MANDGLAQVDLNVGARLALCGLSDTPEADIANLLASGEPIEPSIRKELADALMGRGKSIELRAIGKQKEKVFRSFRLRLKRIALGEVAIKKIEEVGRKEAFKIIAKDVGEKNIELCIASFRKFEAFRAEIAKNYPEFSTLDEECIKVAFAYADAARQDLTKVLSGPIEVLTEAITFAESSFADAGKQSYLPQLKDGLWRPYVSS